MTITLEEDTTTETGGEDRTLDIVRQAQKAFDRAARILASSCDELEATPGGSEVEVVKSLRQMNSAYVLTMDLREKAREAGCKRFGANGAGELNLDEARTQIGLRLACLRGQGHGGSISGEPE
jgi:hypothetical protein